MADYFISYTSSDRVEAHWIAQELRALGHVAHVHEWEIAGGGDIAGWMQDRFETADHVLCVVSQAYLKALYSTWERNAALWEAVNRPGFVLFVVIKLCVIPRLLAPFKRCELHGLPEPVMRERLLEYIKNPTPPAGHISLPIQFVAESNITIRVPAHFMGRDDALAAIDKALSRQEGRAAIMSVQGTTLHGMRGVGKTVLAAAYAQINRDRYRATWWIRADSASTTRGDLAALGIRLGWIAADATDEQAAVAAVLDRLQHEGEGILLLYDNARDATSLRPFLPRGGGARVLITSNDHAWRKIVELVEIRLWPEEVGADFVVARAGRADDRAGALALSKALAGLPLAHEQAAAYCERLEVSFEEYRQRFEAAPVALLDDADHASEEYYDHRTVARTFSLAIEEAAKLHPAAEPLIVHAALLAPEPIPRYLFSEGRTVLGVPLATALANDGLLKAIAALRAFALVELETVPDEREPAIKTDAIRLHRLVRDVAAARSTGREEIVGRLIEATRLVYPQGALNDFKGWPRARRLDPLAMALVGQLSEAAADLSPSISWLLDRLASYRQGALAAHAEARKLFERALTIRKRVLGPDHPDSAISLNNLATVLRAQGDFATARPLYERAIEINERVLGPEHPEIATNLDNLGGLLQTLGDFVAAQALYTRALAITEKALGPDHPDTATNLSNLATLLQSQGQFAMARPLYERALAIRERALEPNHPHMAVSLNNLASLLEELGDFVTARTYFERALLIRERVLGPDHPDTAGSLNNLANLLRLLGDFATAQPLLERALAISEKILGRDHPDTAVSLTSLANLFRAKGDFAAALPFIERALAIRELALGAEHPATATSLDNLATLRRAQGNFSEARRLYERGLEICERALGPDHPDTANSLNNLANLLEAEGDFARARPLYERALSVTTKVVGPNHPDTATSLNNLANLLQSQGHFAMARPLLERALAIRATALGPDHSETASSLNNLAALLQDLGDLAAARPLYERALAICEKALGPDHPETAASLHNLAYLYKDLGKFAAARPLYERALAINEKASGSHHPDTANSLNGLARLLESLGDLLAARPLFERALEIREQVLGSNHHDTATSLNNLAAVLEKLGDFAKAEPLYARALRIREQTFGPDHPTTGGSLNNLAGLHLRLGNFALARYLFGRALAIYEKSFGRDHPTTKIVAANFANMP